MTYKPYLSIRAVPRLHTRAEYRMMFYPYLHMCRVWHYASVQCTFAMSSPRNADLDLLYSVPLSEVLHKTLGVALESLHFCFERRSA